MMTMESMTLSFEQAIVALIISFVLGLCFADMLASKDTRQKTSFSVNTSSNTSSSSKNPHNYTHKDGPFKMIFLVNKSLKMGRGKECAQVAHASMALGRQCQEQDPTSLELWENESYAKVVLKADSLEEMEEVAKMASEQGMPNVMIADAGRTQIPSGSHTVLGLGPAPSSVLDELTGQFKLL